MTKTLHILLLLIAAATSAIAQADFRPGYIVPSAGDTVRGLVDHRGAQRNAIVCRFRAAAAVAVTTYQPAQLKGYGFAQGSRYEARGLPGADSSLVFLEALVKGAATLYVFRDANGTDHYYLGRSNGETIELIQQDTIQDIAGPEGSRRTQVRSYPFRRILTTEFGACPALSSTIARTELGNSQLIKLFRAYNSCAGGEQASVVPERRPTKVRLSVLGGGYRATATLNDEGEVEVKSKLRPAFGVGLTVAPARFNERWTLRIEALYATQQYKAQYDRPGPFIAPLSRRFQAELNSVRLPAMIRYTMSRGVVRPFVQAGLQAVIMLQREASVTIAPAGPGFSPQTREIALRPMGYGGLVGAGLSIPTGQAGALQVGARYDSLDSASEASNRFSGAKGLYFLLGYSFGQ